MTKSEAANKALGSIVGRGSDIRGRSTPLWNEVKHDKSIIADVAGQAAVATSVKGGDGSGNKSQRGSLEVKGGPGSGNFNHGGLHGVHGGSGEKPNTPKGDASQGPNISNIARGRVKFEKNRLAREIIGSAARIKEIDEKPFRSVSDRLEARKHLKQMRKKAKALDIPEDQVWEVIDSFPIEEQAFLAQTAKLEQNNSKARKVAENVGRFLVGKKIQDVSAKYAPSPLIEEGEIEKLSILETAAYLGAYASDPGKSAEFLKALSDGDVGKAHRIRKAGFLDARSNTQNHLRDKDWIETAQALKVRLGPTSLSNMTQREFIKRVNDEQRQRSEAILRQHREARGEPKVRFAGFGGNVE